MAVGRIFSYGGKTVWMLIVGFVGAAESKEALLASALVPCVIVRGRRGGSAMAAAALNAVASENE